ncbi:MAG: hypothetical protein WAM53_12970 [Terrimicrobiaceae bacterium]
MNSLSGGAAALTVSFEVGCGGIENGLLIGASRSGCSQKSEVASFT